MATSISSAASVVNAALARIGYKLFIGNLHDGSAAAQVALQVYGQTRDTLMRDGSWGFAQREVALTLLKSAPAAYTPGVTDWDPTTNPQVGFKFEYAYPTDGLKVRAVRPTPIFVPNYDPRPWPFSIANDNYYTPGRRVILTNLASAICVYTGRVADPSLWQVDFTQALVEALGEPLGASLATMDAAKVEGAEGRVDKAMAQMEQG